MSQKHFHARKNQNIFDIFKCKIARLFCNSLTLHSIKPWFWIKISAHVFLKISRKPIPIVVNNGNVIDDKIGWLVFRVISRRSSLASVPLPPPLHPTPLGLITFIDNHTKFTKKQLIKVNLIAKSVYCVLNKDHSVDQPPEQIEKMFYSVNGWVYTTLRRLFQHILNQLRNCAIIIRSWIIRYIGGRQKLSWKVVVPGVRS